MILIDCTNGTDRSAMHDIVYFMYIKTEREETSENIKENDLCCIVIQKFRGKILLYSF